MHDDERSSQTWSNNTATNIQFSELKLEQFSVKQRIQIDLCGRYDGAEIGRPGEEET
jgi:hypothetical protein